MDLDVVLEVAPPIRKAWVKAVQASRSRFDAVADVMRQNRVNAVAAESFFAHVVPHSMLKDDGMFEVSRAFCVVLCCMRNS